MVLPGPVSYLVIPIPESGSLDISAATGTTTALSEDQEAGASAQGWYLPVNWSDDDKDGWTANGAPPDAVYTPDKSGTFITNGDRDLFKFSVGLGFPIPAEGSLKLTYDTDKIKVWRTQTKKDGDETSASSFVASGTDFTNTQLDENPVFYAEGINGSASFKDAFIQITMVTVPGGVQMDRLTDRVEVTVFEIPMTRARNEFSNRDPDNEVKYYGADGTWGISDNHNGKISWDDYNGNGTPDEVGPGPNNNDQDPYCKYFCNVVEFQFTVNVLVPVNLPQLGYDLGRAAWGSLSRRLEGNETWSTSKDKWWDFDDRYQADEDLTPSSSRHIYSVDGPGFGSKTRDGEQDYVASKTNFLEYSVISIYDEWYLASNYTPWHSQVYLKPKPATPNSLTRDNWEWQKLGGGWLKNVSDPTKYD